MKKKKKSEKSKQCSVFVWQQAELLRRQCAPEQPEWPRQAPSWNHTQHLGIKPHSFGLCEHLWFNSVYFVN